MAGLRRTLPIFSKSCEASSPQPFHTLTKLSVKARQSPKIASKARVNTAGALIPAKTIHIHKPTNPEAALPPATLLNSASKSGALDISPDKALRLLRQYQELARWPGAGWERRFCDENGVNPSTFYLLAKILNRCETNAQRSLARKIMHSASALGVREATFELIESSFLKGTLNLEEFSLPLRRVGVLAKEDQDPQAMALLGRVMHSLGKEDEALELFRDSTAARLDFESASEALIQQGRILLARKDRSGAESVFKKAALELDDPNGYFYLSQLQSTGSSEREVYLLKAASSGVAEACHNLGSLEMGRIQVQGPGTEKAKVSGKEMQPLFSMASDWFQVAAAQGFGPSMLKLAMICKITGDLEDGERWLEKAGELPEIKEQARRIRAQWESESIEIL